MRRSGKNNRVMEGPKITQRKKRQPRKKVAPQVRVPPDLEARLKTLAVTEGSSFNQLCVDFLTWALETYLAKNRQV